MITRNIDVDNHLLVLGLQVINSMCKTDFLNVLIDINLIHIIFVFISIIDII